MFLLRISKEYFKFCVSVGFLIIVSCEGEEFSSGDVIDGRITEVIRLRNLFLVQLISFEHHVITVYGSLSHRF